MFRTVRLSIIRSFSLYTQQWYMSCRLHVGFHSKNRFEKLVHLVGFIIRNSEQSAIFANFRLCAVYPKFPVFTQTSGNPPFTRTSDSPRPTQTWGNQIRFYSAYLEIFAQTIQHEVAEERLRELCGILCFVFFFLVCLTVFCRCSGTVGKTGVKKSCSNWR